MLRMAGHWDPWLDKYSKSSWLRMRTDYHIFRYSFYADFHGLTADYANRKGL